MAYRHWRITLLKGFDTPSWTLNHAHAILAAGYGAVGLYLRSDRTPPQEIAGLKEMGIKIFSIWERGYPTSNAYFSAGQGALDAERAVAYAKLIGQPQMTEGGLSEADKSSQIFFCVDYDPDDNAISGPIAQYFAAAQRVCKQNGYLASVYGSGECCGYLTNMGLCHTGYLSMSTGFRGYHAFKSNPLCSIVQETTQSVAGLSADIDTIVDESVLWLP